MPNPNATSRNATRFAKSAVTAFLLTTSFCMLHGVALETCQLLHNFAWVALEILRPALSAACESVSAHLCGGSTLAPHLLQAVAANWSVASWIAGQ